METQGHLIVDVARLNAAGEDYAGETDAGALDLGDDAICNPLGGICYHLRVEQIGQELLARGQVWHRFACTCSRCAEPIDLEVRETRFFANYPVTPETDFVDLTPEMREAIILALPGYPVCRKDCKGLCARCGANLNREPCTCRHEPEGPWAGLDLLKKP